MNYAPGNWSRQIPPGGDWRRFMQVGDGGVGRRGMYPGRTIRLSSIKWLPGAWKGNWLGSVYIRYYVTWCEQIAEQFSLSLQIGNKNQTEFPSRPPLVCCQLYVFTGWHQKSHMWHSLQPWRGDKWVFFTTREHRRSQFSQFLYLSGSASSRYLHVKQLTTTK